eukprot:scaffold11355_cov59-Phaeocystis_antarctica.AAC.4
MSLYRYVALTNTLLNVVKAQANTLQVRQPRQRALPPPHVGPIEPQRADHGRRLGVAPAVRQAPGRPLLLQHPLPQPQHGRVVRGAGGQAALRVELLGVGRHGAALSKVRLKRVSSRPASLGWPHPGVC